MHTAIDIQNLVVEFPARHGRVRAVDGLNLRVDRGQVFGFIGPNGAGKTTTMHALLGFIAPTAGTVRVFDSDVRQALARRRIGYMSEHTDTYRFLTGRELLRMMGRLFAMPEAQARRRADELLEQVGLAGAARRRIAVYSRGMLQRLGLAQALINDPELVILDEPTSGFDPPGRIEVRRIIEGLHARGCTVFLSSHELSEVEKVCDRVGIIVGGRLAAAGAIADLARPGESLEQYFLGLLA